MHIPLAKDEKEEEKATALAIENGHRKNDECKTLRRRSTRLRNCVGSQIKEPNTNKTNTVSMPIQSSHSPVNNSPPSSVDDSKVTLTASVPEVATTNNEFETSPSPTSSHRDEDDHQQPFKNGDNRKRTSRKNHSKSKKSKSKSHSRGRRKTSKSVNKENDCNGSFFNTTDSCDNSGFFSPSHCHPNTQPNARDDSPSASFSQLEADSLSARVEKVKSRGRRNSELENCTDSVSYDDNRSNSSNHNNVDETKTTDLVLHNDTKEESTEDMPFYQQIEDNIFRFER